MFRPGRARPLPKVYNREMSGDDRRRSREERIRTCEAWLARYEPLVDDPAAFRTALAEPPPLDLLVPRGAAARDALAERLGARGLRSEPSPWSAHHLRVFGHESRGAGALPEVVYGFAYPQGVSSAVSPLAMAPSPGEMVLDMCAAPGGKTVHIASLAEDRARVLAADRVPGRAGILVQTLARMGLVSTVSLVQDGGAFPAAARFDAIQLDAPCTGEGTFRVPSPRYDPRGEQGLEEASRTQRRLLGRALSLLAPGGRLVYSTCAFAPEENEAVLAWALRERDDIRLAPLPADFPGIPGLTRWGEQSFPKELEHARRVLPHHTGSWGFFVALVEKSADSTSVARRKTERAPEPPRDDPEARSQALTYLRERFGVGDDALDDVLVLKRGRDIWALRRLPEEREDADLGRMHVAAPGLRLVHLAKRTRATTAALRWLGPRLREGVVPLSWDQALELLAEGRAPVPADAPGGHVALSIEGHIVGAGLVARGSLELEIPKAWRAL